MQAVRRELVLFAVSMITFVICCWIMLKFGSRIDDPIFVAPYATIAGISAFLWPIFLIRCIRKYLHRDR